MPSLKLEKELLMLRQQYGQLFYIAAKIGGNSYGFIVRPLTLIESKAVSKIGDSMPPYEVNDIICEWCVLAGDPVSPEDVRTIAIACLSDNLAEAIINNSGFTDPNIFMAKLEEARKSQNSIEGVIEAFICSAFPGTTKMDVQNMTLNEQVDKLAKAEVLLGTQVPIGKEGQKGKRRRGKRSPQAEWLLSKEAADKIDVNRESIQQREFITGRDIIDPHGTMD